MMSFYVPAARRRLPAGAGCQSLPAWFLHGVDGSAAVFVPQVDGFGDDGVGVLLRDLPEEKPAVGGAELYFSSLLLLL